MRLRAASPLRPGAIFSSKVVEDEIAACPEPKRTLMVRALQALPLRVLPIPSECSDLADQYIRAGIIPARFKHDALHVAVAVWHGLDVIVSWNMSHLVNIRKVDGINAVNERRRLPHIRIHTPDEVLEL